MSHGYRVYRVDLLEAMGRRAIDTWQVSSGSYAPYVHQLAAAMASDQHLLQADPSWGLVQNMEAFTGATEAKQGDRFIRWLSSTQRGRRLSFVVKYGRVGSYSDAMGVGGDTPIGDKAPGRAYRAELLLPVHDGPGLLAVETISRSAPVEPIVLWLAAASVIKEAGGVWWRLRANQAADGEYLSELINRTDKAEVQLKQVGVDEIGDQPRTRYRLSAPLSIRQRSRAVDWILSRLSGEGDLTGMLDIVGVSNTGDLQFTDGHINVDDGETRTKIGLSDVREIFTYPISTDRPSDETWEQHVRSRFARLDPALGWQ